MKYLDYPPIWLLAFMVLTWGLAELGLVILLSFWLRFLGGVLIALGVMLMGLAVFAMRRHHTTVVPHRIPSDIVTDGVYRLTRNPIYLGDAFTLAGFALLFGSPAGVFLIPVFMTVIQRRFIAEEETWLRTKFSEEFQTWAQKTRRWL
ncbi:methyltransferase family protein [Celeribacter persicus]|uniref:Protein-S-isoprenylcysteine O-methyltransferase Ste14 n=1 Tax=Celeribacter persicus TaxID=1651082 RepID=A0A2T5HLX8_9RHOB|nr:isoprenylcysteine carboxylmethyltransferase family protein [Celeribacter persicus]PTQ72587.1 protein-S-isoprenylcysteine O-methyltransferase Ste14 [Celeribacter persicus]